MIPTIYDTLKLRMNGSQRTVNRCNEKGRGTTIGTATDHEGLSGDESAVSCNDGNAFLSHGRGMIKERIRDIRMKRTKMHFKEEMAPDDQSRSFYVGHTGNAIGFTIKRADGSLLSYDAETDCFKPFEVLPEDGAVSALTTNPQDNHEKYACYYACYFCGDFHEIITEEEYRRLESAGELYRHDTLSYEPIFDGIIYPTLSDSSFAQLAAFGYHYSDDRRTKPSPAEIAAAVEEEPFWQNVDDSKITDSARVSVTWDSYGIAVDLNYSYDEVQGYGESVLCFCEIYEDGNPDQFAWEEAQSVGQLLRQKYNLPMDTVKDDAFLIKAARERASLDAQIHSALDRAAGSQNPVSPEGKAPRHVR